MKARTFAIGSAAAVLALVGGTFAWTVARSGGDLADCLGGQVAGGAIGGPFELVDEAGATVTSEEVLTEPTLLYFGYTFCPDVCPLDTARNATALDLLAERGIEAQGVFVTVDPTRDTPEVLADFTDSFHPDIRGLSGTTEQVDAAAKAYKVYYQLHDDEDPDYYLVDHSNFTYLVLPERGFVDFFRADASPDAVAERTACVVDAVN
ncbi:PrrC [Oceanicola granulosus HTCC2516]|uniref:PrrC n=1 Tax=Oceanicola granulosus (strain ATCC BAA-861 / DSM 15982 / KCTC 12143 / HTCC2516) TaxID=314256 RepID=Q2CJX2_OCEGH|nr:SCO family protein [Oceanicola granulosus]EAR53017.1 PrrC [Oceanicola granulosus HTCC2516]